MGVHCVITGVRSGAGRRRLPRPGAPLTIIPYDAARERSALADTPESGWRSVRFTAYSAIRQRTRPSRQIWRPGAHNRRQLITSGVGRLGRNALNTGRGRILKAVSPRDRRPHQAARWSRSGAWAGRAKARRQNHQTGRRRRHRQTGLSDPDQAKPGSSGPRRQNITTGTQFGHGHPRPSAGASTEASPRGLGQRACRADGHGTAAPPAGPRGITNRSQRPATDQSRASSSAVPARYPPALTVRRAATHAGPLGERPARLGGRMRWCRSLSRRHGGGIRRGEQRCAAGRQRRRQILRHPWA